MPPSTLTEAQVTTPAAPPPAPSPPHLTLRDQFAMAALTGMMGSRNPSSPRFHPEDDAAYVYAVADAMLKARGQ